MMTSLDPIWQLGTEMLTSACHVDQSQRDTCQPRINSAFFIFRNGFNLQKFITNSYDLRKI